MNSAPTNSVSYIARYDSGAARNGIENKNTNERGSGAIVVTGILSVCSLDAIALIDPGSTHSYVSSYFAIRFDKLPKLLKDLFLVATPVGESLLVKRVYHSSQIYAQGKGTLVYLFVLDMVDFDLIMGMDWLASCHAIVDCHSKIVHFNIHGEPSFMLQGDQVSPPNNLKAFMSAKRMLSKGCQGFVAFVKDMEIMVPDLGFVLVVSEFLDVFLEDLHGVPPDRETDFGID
ncbi:uncharacterized protein LOC125845740 [Solanum stenotomum]|uniref:uncharacterized protein LOC125845740 n=1 Tax=Solanum stenotomum TaxID=172797 RepID=UPI0020D10D66|nr:uncharacterized protein LOC125845740 [Solanum stenotomum]